MLTQTNYLMPGQDWKAVYRLNSSKLIIVPILFWRIVNVPDRASATIDEKLENPEGLAVVGYVLKSEFSPGIKPETSEKLSFWVNQIIPDPNVTVDESNFCGYIPPNINLGNVEEYLELNDTFWCFGEQSLLEKLQK